MFHLNLGRAWTTLIIYLLLAVASGYLAVLLAIELNLVTPLSVLAATTSGLRHVGKPLLLFGVNLGFDRTVMMFLANLTVALLIVSSFYWAALLNPAYNNKRFMALRRRLQKDRSAKLLQTIPPFRHIWSPHLRLTAFLLLTVPLVGTMTLGLLTGAMLGAARYVFNSHLTALAYIMPHGCLELAAFLLACCIPFGAWLTIRDDLARGRLTTVFSQIDQLAGSSQLQLSLKTIISLLWVAVVVESVFTLKVVDLLKDI